MAGVTVYLTCGLQEQAMNFPGNALRSIIANKSQMDEFSMMNTQYVLVSQQIPLQCDRIELKIIKPAKNFFVLFWKLPGNANTNPEVSIQIRALFSIFVGL